MALYVLVLTLLFLIACSDFGADLEKALFADVIADGCLTEDCPAPALSLLQVGAVAHHRLKRASAGQIEAGERSSTRLGDSAPGTHISPSATSGGEVGDAVVAHNDAERSTMPMSFLQFGATVENKEGSKEDSQQARTADTSVADSTAALSYNIGVEVHRDTGVEVHRDTGIAERQEAFDSDRMVGLEDAAASDEIAEPDLEVRDAKENLSLIERLSDDAARQQVAASVFCVFGFMIIVAIMWVMCFRIKVHSLEGGSDSPCIAERSQVEALQRCTACQIDEKLPLAGGYDCVLGRPRSTGEPVRLEAYIEGSADGSALLSPLKQHLCVRFSAAVYGQERDGMRSHPLALRTGSSRFVVSLVDAPQVRIEVQGDDVTLFDMHDGHSSSRQAFASAPDNWQEFAVAWQVGNGAQQSGDFVQSNEEELEFRESALIVGSRITLVGELHRDAIGRLQLHPWQPDAQMACEPWRTSWEQSGCDRPGTSSGKILASDDPALLSAAWQRFSLAWPTLGLFSKPFSSREEATPVAVAVPPLLQPCVANTRQVQKESSESSGSSSSGRLADESSASCGYSSASHG